MKRIDFRKIDLLQVGSYVFPLFLFWVILLIRVPSSLQPIFSCLFTGFIPGRTKSRMRGWSTDEKLHDLSSRIHSIW